MLIGNMLAGDIGVKDFQMKNGFSFRVISVLCLSILSVLLFCNLSFAEFGTISIHFVDESGNSVDNVQMMVVDSADEYHILASVDTGPYGDNSIFWDRLLPGSYKLYFIPKSFIFKESWFNKKNNFDDADVIQIIDGQTTYIEGVLERASLGSIDGEIVDSSGNPISYAQVELFNEEQQLLQSCITDTSGEFVFNSLSDGFFKLNAKHLADCYQDSWYIAKNNFDEATLIQIVGENVVSDIVVTLGGQNTCSEEIIPDREQIHLPDEQIPWAWFSYVPRDVDKSKIIYIMVSGATAFDDVNYYDVIYKYRGGRTDRPNDLNVVSLIPAIPRYVNEVFCYATAFTKDSFRDETAFEQRADLKLNLMIDKLKKLLKDQGYNVADKIIIEGFSAGGMFAQRYSLLHPERVLAITGGQCGGSVTVPDNFYENTDMTWPVGVSDMRSLVGYDLDFTTYKYISQLIYIGDQDKYNSTVGIGNDTFDYGQMMFLNEKFGDNDPERVESQCAYMKNMGCNVTFEMYPGVGHDYPPGMYERINEFFIAAMQGPIISSFTAQPDKGLMPVVSKFKCDANSSDGSSIILYQWDFDNDGVVDDTTALGEIAYTYSYPGTYTATCIVTDDKERVAISSPINIHVTPSYEQGSYNYFLPYFSSDPFGNYWTGLGLANKDNSQSSLTEVTVYNDGGCVLSMEYQTIAAHGQKAFPVATNLNENGWIKVNSHQPMAGLAFLGSGGAFPVMADIPFVSDLSTCLIIPHIAQNDNWDTTIYLCTSNGGEISLKYFDNSGLEQGSRNYTLSDLGSGVYPLSVVFSDKIPLAGRIEISAPNGVAAFALYSNLKSGGSYYAGINADTCGQ